MKKILLFLVPVILAVSVFVGFIFFLQKNNVNKGALQVTSQPASKVFLNGKEIGKTPLCKCDPKDMLATGDYTVRLVPINSGSEPYEEKITLTQSVLTVVDRTFGDVGKSSGSVISLTPIKDEKNAQVFIASFPYGADISMDSIASGTTPVTLDHVTDSDHELNISKSGYKAKTIRIHGVMGYKLSAIVSLSTDLTPVTIPSLNSSLQPSATGTPAISPVGGSPTTTPLQGPQVTILNTPTGFLRVRDSASLGGTEVAQVHPGESYPFVSEQDGWFQIKLNDGKIGWVNASYAKKQ